MIIEEKIKERISAISMGANYDEMVHGKIKNPVFLDGRVMHKGGGIGFSVLGPDFGSRVPTQARS